MVIKECLQMLALLLTKYMLDIEPLSITPSQHCQVRNEKYI